MGCSSSRSNDAILIQGENGTLPSRRCSAAPELSKNRAAIDSSKAISVLARLLGPESETVRNALSGIIDPMKGTPLHYWSCKECAARNSAPIDKCRSCKVARRPSTEMNIAIEDESAVENHDTSSALDDALSAVECPICLETYKNPVVLPCGHSFCAEHTPSVEGKCPFCRKEFTRMPASDVHLVNNVKAVISFAEVIDPERLTVRDAVKNLAGPTASEGMSEELMRQEQIRLDEQLARDMQSREYDPPDDVIQLQLAAEALFNM